MESILKNFRILNIPVKDNPLLILNLFIFSCKNDSDEDIVHNETLCVGALDNIFSHDDIKKFFSNFGTIKFFNVLEKEYLSKNFQNFSYCIYIKYIEENAIETILRYTVDLNNCFTSSTYVPYFINMESKNYTYFLKKYYDDYYNLNIGRKTIIKDILNLNKDNKHHKKTNLVDNDGFTIVQKYADKPDNINSIFSNNNEKIKNFTKKRKSQIHEGFYLFQKKGSFNNLNPILPKNKKTKKS
ncbi:conserved Plasmodium protein, unknown function [Plasmodium vinckei lentum]|uniref:Ribosomal RNA-processing protein 7 C-terminal domain-containing protein n=1 Tax=Plasmodium vinckei lentum TaxID=138297 RepID=A0A6V7SAQ2_PLAVN|nr:conserved Plasmodium protein, unknown function [Plasmodium vinckei lentum]